MRLRIFILIVISTPHVRLRIGGAADAVTTAYGGVVRFLRETCMFVLESNHPGHRSVARPSPPIRKRQEGYLEENITCKRQAGYLKNKMIIP